MRPVLMATLVLFALSVVTTVVFLVQSCSQQSERRQQAIALVDSVRQKAAQAESIASAGERVLQLTNEEMRMKGLAVGALAQDLVDKRVALDALMERHRADSQHRRRNLDQLGLDAERAEAEIAALQDAVAAKIARLAPRATVSAAKDDVARLDRLVASLRRRVLEEEIAANAEELLVDHMASMAQRIDAARADAAAAALKIADGRRRNLANQERLAQLHSSLAAARCKLDAILNRLRR